MKPFLLLFASFITIFSSINSVFSHQSKNVLGNGKVQKRYKFVPFNEKTVHANLERCLELDQVGTKSDPCPLGELDFLGANHRKIDFPLIKSRMLVQHEKLGRQFIRLLKSHKIPELFDLLKSVTGVRIGDSNVGTSFFDPSTGSITIHPIHIFGRNWKEELQISEETTLELVYTSEEGSNDHMNSNYSKLPIRFDDFAKVFDSYKGRSKSEGQIISGVETILHELIHAVNHFPIEAVTSQIFNGSKELPSDLELRLKQQDESILSSFQVNSSDNTRINIGNIVSKFKLLEFKSKISSQESNKSLPIQDSLSYKVAMFLKLGRWIYYTLENSFGEQARVEVQSSSLPGTPGNEDEVNWEDESLENSFDSSPRSSMYGEVLKDQGFNEDIPELLSKYLMLKYFGYRSLTVFYTKNEFYDNYDINKVDISAYNDVIIRSFVFDKPSKPEIKKRAELYYKWIFNRESDQNDNLSKNYYLYVPEVNLSLGKIRSCLMKFSEQENKNQVSDCLLGER